MKITVRVHPKAKTEKIVPVQKELLKPETSGMADFEVYTHEPAQENRANEAILELLGAYFDVPKSSIIILKGHKSRIKVIEIDK